jgi:hypothetical protein
MAGEGEMNNGRQEHEERMEGRVGMMEGKERT